MPVQIEEPQQGNVVVVKVHGRLDGKDYDVFVPVIEAMIQKHGKIRIVLEMHDFRGWDASALWDDIKFDWKHYSDIERIAMVGNSKWEQGMSIFCRPFTRAEIRYFPEPEREAALAWIAEPESAGSKA